MSATIRIATFNCENLFTRYKFREGVRVEEISEEGWDINKVKFEIHDPKTRSLTGKAIRVLDADVVALQEVENLDVVKRFRTRYLGGFRAYPHVVVVDGNDPRLIDVAVISRYPIVHARSYQQMKESPRKRSFIFSRDCLEVDVKFHGIVITLFVNHFKSMVGGRSRTRARRLTQAKAVKQIVTDRFGPDPGRHPFIILGDLNDYMETDRHGKPGIEDIVNWGQVENVVDRLPIEERWTHYYKGQKAYRQLDYILTSNVLSAKVKTVEIERGGVPRRATKYAGPRFRGVGEDCPKASDHCPLMVEIKI